VHLLPAVKLQNNFVLLQKQKGETGHFDDSFNGQRAAGNLSSQAFLKTIDLSL
jgi:hypothetical protein